MASIHDDIIHMCIPTLKRKKLVAKECLCVFKNVREREEERETEREWECVCLGVLDQIQERLE